MSGKIYIKFLIGSEGREIYEAFSRPVCKKDIRFRYYQLCVKFTGEVPSKGDYKIISKEEFERGARK